MSKLTNLLSLGQLGTRRLAPIVVTHLETHHAYTKPPQPEKGGLPTIIVTPDNASSVSDFEIHFFSPKPTQTTFEPSTISLASSRGFGILPRMRSLFRRSTPIAEARDSLDEEEKHEEDEEDKESNNGPKIIVTPPSAGGRRAYGYSAIPQDEDLPQIVDVQSEIPGVPTITESHWTRIHSPINTTSINGFTHSTTTTTTTTTTISISSGLNSPTAEGAIMLGGASASLAMSRRPSMWTRRARMMLFLSVPLALITFHLFSYQSSLFGGPNESGMHFKGESWGEDMSLAGPNI
ncbi:hypothetical protein CPB86DRAFT_189785 [Serendipita vermifera]|nr:hypothetical protein CPB86DRAFT_189785 [Serendipita vermifera]